MRKLLWGVWERRHTNQSARTKRNAEKEEILTVKRVCEIIINFISIHAASKGILENLARCLASIPNPCCGLVGLLVTRS